LGERLKEGVCGLELITMVNIQHHQYKVEQH
jgi:hypothetical protein